MGKHRLLARRRRASSRTGYITAAVLGLTVGMSAWTMSHPAGSAVPTITFGTAADTPVPTASPTPSAHRTGFVLTPATTGSVSVSGGREQRRAGTHAG